MKKKDLLVVGKNKFYSRLIVGTGKYKTMAECAKAIKISGANIVTVAVKAKTGGDPPDGDDKQDFEQNKDTDQDYQS